MTARNHRPPPGGYRDLRPDVAVSPDPLPASPTGTAQASLRARLAALDDLYESNTITVTELSRARSALLVGRVDEGRARLIGADASLFVNEPLPAPKRARVAGLPVWTAAAIAGALVVARAAPMMLSARRRV